MAENNNKGAAVSSPPNLQMLRRALFLMAFFGIETGYQFSFRIRGIF